MSHRKVIETYYIDINNLADLLGKLVNSYRLLVGGADELNKIALAKKKDVKAALERAEELGDIIDYIIRVLDVLSVNYTNYCELKSEAVKGKLQLNYIETEIDDELKFDENKK